MITKKEPMIEISCRNCKKHQQVNRYMAQCWSEGRMKVFTSPERLKPCKDWQPAWYFIEAILLVHKAENY